MLLLCGLQTLAPVDTPLLLSVSEEDAVYLPAAHVSHVVCPAEAWNFPAAQSSHVVCPAEDWYFPASQSPHAVCPAKGWYFPAAQSSHELSTKALYVPAMHGLQNSAPVDTPVVLSVTEDDAV